MNPTDAEIASDVRAIEQELRTIGEVADCDHLACHTPIADGWCIRHELAHTRRRLAMIYPLSIG